MPRLSNRRVNHRAGVHPKIVQERLGRSSIAITLDTYSHVAPGLQHAAANKMDEIFSRSPEKSVTKSLPSADKLTNLKL